MSVSDNESNNTDNSLWKHHYPIDEDALTQHAEFVNLNCAMAFREKRTQTHYRFVCQPTQVAIFNSLTGPESDLNGSLTVDSMPRHDDPVDIFLF